VLVAFDPVLICPSLIIGVGIGRYMIHVSWLSKLILVLALAVILAESTLIQVNFLGKLCIKLLISSHLAEVIVSK
jgi:tartrate dehydratase alpha subunit/fumarate hydratase class I-like protein